MNAWNPSDLDKMALPPCHVMCQFFVNSEDKTLDCQLYQRSGDMFLGVPYDVCLFSKILLYVASETNTIPKDIEISIIDAHVYLNHFDAVKQYIGNTSNKDGVKFSYQSGRLILKDYKPGPKIKAPIAV